jgi:hypothetical protein
MRIEVIRYYKNKENREIPKKTNSNFFERTFSPGLCYQPGLNGLPAAVYDPGHVKAL